MTGRHLFPESIHGWSGLAGNVCSVRNGQANPAPRAVLCRFDCRRCERRRLSDKASDTATDFRDDSCRNFSYIVRAHRPLLPMTKFFIGIQSSDLMVTFSFCRFLAQHEPCSRCRAGRSGNGPCSPKPRGLFRASHLPPSPISVQFLTS
ncbi:hypothetical protein BRPE64_ACDS01200 [Caballeronia insecticola]|uniref:Uncharacterized protein n=1 Tax=Caballeronia insecticola TaxID=758793 RepID=R4WEW8_9BURK|nr:hypothetical protein BRPE64_ACDS01200 [Caballeronia insecticola]